MVQHAGPGVARSRGGPREPPRLPWAAHQGAGWPHSQQLRPRRRRPAAGRCLLASPSTLRPSNGSRCLECRFGQRRMSKRTGRCADLRPRREFTELSAGHQTASRSLCYAESTVVVTGSLSLRRNGAGKRRPEPSSSWDSGVTGGAPHVTLRRLGA